MTVNHSSSINESHPSMLSSHFLPSPCFDSAITGYMLTALTCTNIIFLLPLSVLVLSLGFQRWKQQHSISTMSFSEFLTYNMSAMELIGIIGYSISIFAGYTRYIILMWIGNYIAMFPWYAQMYFPILTCVERYIAVVHPVIYLRIRRVGSIRNICTGFVWLQCLGGLGFLVIRRNYPKYELIGNSMLMAIFLTCVTFCSLSVAFVLTRPRPGGACRKRARVEQSKQKAFHTIMIIMGMLWLKFGGTLLCTVMRLSLEFSPSVQCVLYSASGWFCIPSSLVLPLLFLHRRQTLP